MRNRLRKKRNRAEEKSQSLISLFFKGCCWLVEEELYKCYPLCCSVKRKPGRKEGRGMFKTEVVEVF